MMISLGISGADAFADGVVDIQGFNGGTAVLLDRDGAAGPGRALMAVRLLGVDAATVNESSFMV